LRKQEKVAEALQATCVTGGWGGNEMVPRVKLLSISSLGITNSSCEWSDG